MINSEFLRRKPVTAKLASKIVPPENLFTHLTRYPATAKPACSCESILHLVTQMIGLPRLTWRLRGALFALACIAELARLYILRFRRHVNSTYVDPVRPAYERLAGTNWLFVFARFFPGKELCRVENFVKRFYVRWERKAIVVFYLTDHRSYYVTWHNVREGGRNGNVCGSDGTVRRQYGTCLFVIQSTIEQPNCVRVVGKTNWRTTCTASLEREYR